MVEITDIESIKDLQFKTWGDLVNLIQDFLNKLEPNITNAEVIDRYEQLCIQMDKIHEEYEKDKESYNTFIFLFGAALDFILSVSISTKYKFIGIILNKINVEALENMNEENIKDFLMTLITILKMSKEQGSVITLDQCEFVDASKIN